MKVYKIIKKIRHNRIETQKQFAEACNIPISNIKAWETNRCIPNEENIQKLYNIVKSYDIKTAEELLKTWKTSK